MTKIDSILREFQHFEFDPSLLYLVSNSPHLQKCVVDANDKVSSHKPYLPWKSRHAKMYKALTPGERAKILSQTEKIFQSPSVRGPAPKLNPKNPYHMPEIRVWLKIRDCVTYYYYLENKGTSSKNIPSFESLLNDYISTIRHLFTQYNDALVQAELNFKAVFPKDVDLVFVLKKNWIAYIGELYSIVTSAVDIPVIGTIIKTGGNIVKLQTKILNDLKEEKQKMEAIANNRALTEDFASIRAKAKVVLSNFERSINVEKPELEREYNGLSEREKLDYVFRAFVTKPIKTSLEFEAEFYFDFINSLYGHLEISLRFQVADISPIGQPKDVTLPLHLTGLNINKVKVVASKYAKHVANGLDRLKTSFAMIENLDDQFNNLFEWSVNKRLMVKYRPFPPTLPVRTFKRHIIKEKGAANSYALRELELPPEDQKVWKSMVKPGSEELYSSVYLRDYIKKAFDLNKIQNVKIE